ncbi:methylated-DNA--[protein]-cysteine S-methyltransferase [Pokkaliibacter sp. CJK22405]|uniref:methylated-DNA--[protein]-cysteine S-methyltransferase n=1 Tax=Pokkaliibacter sp. CJK22405 TaxID=3384615 RepID=UPI00398466C8
MNYLMMYTPLGNMLLASESQAGDPAPALYGVWFEDQKHRPDSSDWQESNHHPLLIQAKLQLEEYFAGKRQSFDLPLAKRGTAFQQKVWASLQRIPFNQTRNYRQLAEMLEQPSAVRAVANANGRNPFTLIVPCHRVIGSDGSLTGYAGGLDRKAWLLKHEGLHAEP